MKFVFILTLLTIFLQIFTAKSKLKSSSSLIAENLTTSAQVYAPFARLAYCPRAIISDFKCEFCNEFAEGYATYFIHSALYNNNRLFQLVVVYSDMKREIVISFSGPKEALKEIYESGHVMIPELGNIKMEREFWDVYSVNFRQVLAQKIQQITESGRGDYTFVFLGHSAGGSLATLAAYDMVNSNVVIKTSSSPKVYTYGQLSIGDENFVKNVNETLKVVRIVKKNDFVVRSVKYCKDTNGKVQCSRPKIKKIKKIINRSHRYKPLTPIKKTKTIKKKAGVDFNQSIRKTMRIILKNDTKNHKQPLKSSFIEVAKDPIIRGTQMLNGQLVPQIQPEMMYSQPIGTEVVYGQTPKLCPYVNGIPICEKKYSIPTSFSTSEHQNYYNMNMMNCQ